MVETFTHTDLALPKAKLSMELAICRSNCNSLRRIKNTEYQLCETCRVALSTKG